MKFLSHKSLAAIAAVICISGCQKSFEMPQLNTAEDWEKAEHPLPKIVLSSKDLYSYQDFSIGRAKENNLGYQPEFMNYWDISPEVIREINAALPEYIKNDHYTFSQYGLQYIGNIEKNGGKSVAVFGFCSLPKKLLPFVYHQPYMVFGGGKCYFKAVYDPELKKFTKVGFNGPK